MAVTTVHALAILDDADTEQGHLEAESLVLEWTGGIPPCTPSLVDSIIHGRGERDSFMLDSTLGTESTEEIPVIKSRSLKKGPTVVVGVIKAEVLIDRCHTALRNARTKEGYQREPSRARVSRLKVDLRRHRVDLPTAVLLSMRDGSEASLRQTEKGLFLSLNSKRLYVVDGQHRSNLCAG